MKVLVVIAAILAVSTARPQSPKDAVVETQSFDNIGTGPFNWAFRSNDGVDRQESGLLKNVNSANPSLSVSGTYTYVVDGKTISVSYVADENGFQPKGAHIPVRKEWGGLEGDINDCSSGGSGNLARRTTLLFFFGAGLLLELAAGRRLSLVNGIVCWRVVSAHDARV
uniref:Uncharacterized protein n=1 Tax=Timema genevievae TaxID=629358 RepID=A0A7R9K264_TIMGE|nr:unnamed protein product [Timema genevievae]